MTDLTLPAFEMDCRDWLVLGAAEAGLPGDAVEAPVLAVLSTAVIDSDIAEATGTLTVGLLDDDEFPARRVAPGAAALELLDSSINPDARRYVMPAPGEHRLAILAEFVVPGYRAAAAELDRRVQALMASFRWQQI
jgi:hypothetical protein